MLRFALFARRTIFTGQKQQALNADHSKHPQRIQWHTVTDADTDPVAHRNREGLSNQLGLFTLEICAARTITAVLVKWL